MSPQEIMFTKSQRIGPMDFSNHLFSYSYINPRYCWWKKSCTSWYGKYPIFHRISYIPGGISGIDWGFDDSLSLDLSPTCGTGMIPESSKLIATSFEVLKLRTSTWQLWNCRTVEMFICPHKPLETRGYIRYPPRHPNTETQIRYIFGPPQETLSFVMAGCENVGGPITSQCSKNLRYESWIESREITGAVRWVYH